MNSSNSQNASERRPLGPLHRALAVTATFLAFAGGWTARAEEEPATRAVAAAARHASACADCTFFAVPVQDSLITSVPLFFVSTLDRMPPPLWAVAVPTKSPPWILTGNDYKGWNAAVGAEKPLLRSDADFRLYTRSFLNLAVGRAVLVEKFTAAQKALVAKKMPKVEQAGLRVIRSETPGGRHRIVCFAQDSAGTLALWDILLLPSGTVLRAQMREF